MTQEHTLKIIFPTKESLSRFKAYMCDGGGECSFFDTEDSIEAPDQIGRFQYHKENPIYPKSDKRRYEAFAEPTIIAQVKRDD
jgi:hypothetical protein